jgi:DNA-binding CsgD family transcriptional regulator
MKPAKLIVKANERPVVLLMARGYQPKQIAAALGMNSNYVCQIRRRVLDRNGITNDTQLGMLVADCQFVSVYERNLIEDRREERMDAQRVPKMRDAPMLKDLLAKGVQ